MNVRKLVTLVLVTLVIAILLASALNTFTRVADDALAESAPTATPPPNVLSNAPPNQKWLPIILLNAPHDLYWSVFGNGGTNPNTNFIGTTDNVTLTFRVNNKVAYRLVPGRDSISYSFSPNIIGGYGGNSVAPGVVGATIGGGGAIFGVNVASGDYSTIGGGLNNTASGNRATITGGQGNSASGSWSFIGGGATNTANNSGATIVGGDFNLASGVGSTIGGGQKNTASDDRTTIGGGLNNTASSGLTTVGGGQSNTASGYAATVAGGQLNMASGVYASIGGGVQNIASGASAVVGGGGYSWGGAISGNKAYAYASTISGGYGNLITTTAIYATIGGGNSNTAKGESATIPGGYGNVAAGDFSLAAGRRAKANHQGAFVWADSTNAPFASTANDQFLIRANGGVGINTNSPQATLDISGSLRVNMGGTVLNRIQAGTTSVPTSRFASTVFTVTFPSVFTTSPRIIATPRGEDLDETFVITTRRVTTTYVVFNIVRVDQNSGWAQDLELDWFAWE